MVEYKPLQASVYQHLKKAILDGEYNFDTIYSETKVACGLGVSRTPVRDALLRLNQEHYVDIIPSKGFMLHKPDHDDFREACQTRLAIEGFCAKQLALRRDEKAGQATIAAMRACLAEMATVPMPENTKDFWALDMRFHRMVIDFMDNSIFEELFSTYMHYFISTIFFPLYVEKRRDQTTLAEHQLLMDAIEKGDPENVERAVKRHLDTSVALTAFTAEYA